jgi:hypothetical protein
MKRKVHMREGVESAWPLCRNDRAMRSAYHGRAPLRTTDDWPSVTCRACKQRKTSADRDTIGDGAERLARVEAGLNPDNRGWKD